MISNPESQPQPEHPPERKKSSRKFVGTSIVPEGALTWGTSRDRATALYHWRKAVSRTFPEAARVVRVAWLLEWLFGKDGFAFANDSHIERELSLPIKKIQAALLDLERAGAIIRVSVFVRGKAQRRIWPARRIIETVFPTVGKMDIPHGGSYVFPTVGGQNTIRKTFPRNSIKISTTAEQARKAAELREARERARPQPDIARSVE